MTQPTLVRLSTLDQEHQLDLSNGELYNPTGQAAYGAGTEKLGLVRDALVNPTTGQLHYLIVDVGGWFSTKHVLVPVGQARFTQDGAYFDRLTKEQVRNLSEYDEHQDYAAERQQADERVLRAADTDEATYRREAFQTPDMLRLLEERLTVNKERFVAGSVSVAKRVETHQENISVALQREEIIIERRAITDARPVEGVVFGAQEQTFQVDLEAERAKVSKQAYVVEEITVGKRAVTDTQTVTETVGREVLDVTKSGDVQVTSQGQSVTDSHRTS